MVSPPFYKVSPTIYKFFLLGNGSWLLNSSDEDNYEVKKTDFLLQPASDSPNYHDEESKIGAVRRL